MMTPTSKKKSFSFGFVSKIKFKKPQAQIGVFLEILIASVISFRFVCYILNV